MSSAPQSPDDRHKPDDRLNVAAENSRSRLRLRGYMEKGQMSIFAKIYVYTNEKSKLSPIPVTRTTDIASLDQVYVFVTIPHSPPRKIDQVEVVRAYTYKIDQYFTKWYDSAGHPITKIDKATLADMADRGLIYSHINKKTGDTEYWYLVQDLDIISRVATRNEDVEQGYIQLVNKGDPEFTPVSYEDMFSSRGGNKCLLKPKSNKRKKKQNKRNSRRRYRSRKH